MRQDPKYWVAVHGYKRSTDEWKWYVRQFYIESNARLYLIDVMSRNRAGRYTPREWIKHNFPLFALEGVI